MAKLVACPERLGGPRSERRRTARDVQDGLDTLVNLNVIKGWTRLPDGKFVFWWEDEGDEIRWQFSNLQEANAFLWGVQFKRQMGRSGFTTP